MKPDRSEHERDYLQYSNMRIIFPQSHSQQLYPSKLCPLLSSVLLHSKSLYLSHYGDVNNFEETSAVSAINISL
jgi:hypothetical protein